MGDFVGGYRNCDFMNVYEVALFIAKAKQYETNRKSSHGYVCDFKIGQIGHLICMNNTITISN